MLKAKYLKAGEFDIQIRMIPARQAFGLSKDVAQAAAQVLGALGKLGADGREVHVERLGPELGAALAGSIRPSWTLSWPAYSPQIGGPGPGTWLPLPRRGRRRVLRGGSWTSTCAF